MIHPDVVKAIVGLLTAGKDAGHAVLINEGVVALALLCRDESGCECSLHIVPVYENGANTQCVSGTRLQNLYRFSVWIILPQPHLPPLAAPPFRYQQPNQPHCTTPTTHIIT